MNSFFTINKETGLFEPSFSSEMLEKVLKLTEKTFPSELENESSIVYSFFRFLADIEDDETGSNFKLVYSVLFGVYKELFSIEDIIEFCKVSGEVSHEVLQNFLKGIGIDENSFLKKELVADFLRTRSIIKTRKVFKYSGEENSYNLEPGSFYREKSPRTFKEANSLLSGDFYANIIFKEVNRSLVGTYFFDNDGEVEKIDLYGDENNPLNTVFYLDENLSIEANSILFGTYYLKNEEGSYIQKILPANFEPEKIYYILESSPSNNLFSLPSEFVQKIIYYKLIDGVYKETNSELSGVFYEIDSLRNRITRFLPEEYREKTIYYFEEFEELTNEIELEVGKIPDENKIEEDAIFFFKGVYDNTVPLDEFGNLGITSAKPYSFYEGTLNIEEKENEKNGLNNYTWFHGKKITSDIQIGKIISSAFSPQTSFVFNIFYSGFPFNINKYYYFDSKLKVWYPVEEISSLYYEEKDKISRESILGNFYSFLSKKYTEFNEDSPFLKVKEDVDSEDFLKNAGEFLTKAKYSYYQEKETFKNFMKAEEKYFSILEENLEFLKISSESFKTEAGLSLYNKIFQNNKITIENGNPDKSLVSFRSLPLPTFLYKPGKKESFFGDYNYDNLLLMALKGKYDKLSNSEVIKGINELISEIVNILDKEGYTLKETDDLNYYNLENLPIYEALYKKIISIQSVDFPSKENLKRISFFGNIISDFMEDDFLSEGMTGFLSKTLEDFSKIKEKSEILFSKLLEDKRFEKFATN